MLIYKFIHTYTIHAHIHTYIHMVHRVKSRRLRHEDSGLAGTGLWAVHGHNLSSHPHSTLFLSRVDGYVFPVWTSIKNID